MLAGWFRLKYPHLVHAAVASSAPVEAILNFEGYNDAVAASMSNSEVGGSKECHDIIADGHATVGEMLKSAKGRQMLASEFNLCDASSLEVCHN